MYADHIEGVHRKPSIWLTWCGSMVMQPLWDQIGRSCDLSQRTEAGTGFMIPRLPGIPSILAERRFLIPRNFETATNIV